MMGLYGWNGLFAATGHNRSNKLLVSRAYTLAASLMTQQIKNLGTCKKRFDIRQDKADQIGHLVEEFLSVKIRMRYSNEEDKEKQLLGRSIFSKYILENFTDVDGKHVRNFLSPLKPMRSSSPASWRQRFTASLRKNQQRSILYQNFLQFVKNNLSNQ